MQTRRTVAVLLVAAGLGLVGVALGLLYMDFKEHQAAFVQAKYGDGTVDTDAWEVDDNDRKALFIGSAGAAAFGAGLLMALFELRWFQATAGSGPEPRRA